MRLIDADKFLSDLDWKEQGAYTEGEIIDMIQGSPTVSAVPVVRCRECICVTTCNRAQFLGLDGYCSHGERISTSYKSQTPHPKWWEL